MNLIDRNKVLKTIPSEEMVARMAVMSAPVVDAIPISFIQQEIDGYYKDEAVTVPGTIINWVIRSKRLGLQYMIDRWKKGQEKENEQTGC